VAVIPDIGTAAAGTWMNPSSVKLFLTLLWLIPGVGLLLHDVWTGRTLGVPFGQSSVPLAVPCLILAAFNVLRWWSLRSRPMGGSSPRVHHRRPREESQAAVDLTFQFDDPPAGSRGPER